MPDNDKLITLDNLGTFKDNIEEEIDSKIQANSSMIANAYDSTSTYAVGDYAIYNGVLYRCKTAVSTAEPFDVAKWEDVKCAELNNEDEIEIVSHQTHTALTDAQIEKAKRGKLVVLMNGQYLTYKTYRESDNTIFFGHSLNLTSTFSSSTVPVALIFNDWGCGLSLTTKKFIGGGSTEFGSITHSSQNFFNNTDTPASTGKQLARALNLRRTQDMLTPNVYDATATYALGDVVIYQNQLYRCTTAIETAEAWDATHWTLTNVVELAKEKGAYIVEVPSTGVQTEELGAKIEKADAIIRGVYTAWRREVNSNDVIFFSTVPLVDGIRIAGNTWIYKPSTRELSSYSSGNMALLTRQQIISDFSSSNSYSPGDFVYYNNLIYRCVTAHTGAWSSSDFTQVVLADEIHSDIVTITATGVQSDEMAAKIENAKALVYNNKTYTLTSKSSFDITFISVKHQPSQTLQYFLSYTISSKTIAESTSASPRTTGVNGIRGSVSLDASLETNTVSSDPTLKLTGKLPYLTTAPTEANTSGFLTIVVLSAEPDTRYSGYMYVITGSNS